MTPLLTINLLRALFVMFALFVGAQIGGAVYDAQKGAGLDGTTFGINTQLLGAIGGALFGLMIVLADRLLKGITLRTFSSATFGLLLGLLFSRLLLASDVLLHSSENVQWIVSLAVYAGFGYIGMMLAVRSNRDEFSLIIPYVRFRQTAVLDAPLLVDTNIIIDGRIEEVCMTGFVSGSLVVPRFVLEELQRLADSADPIKRERGRRGLDTLNQMQKNPGLSVTIHDSVSEKDTTVDSRLLHLSTMLQARLLTNDANLCKIARLQGVSVLNLNDLAKSLRPSLTTGDDLEITLVKEGRDAHQAVGYLPDGTMIVVNHARPHLGETVHVTIAGALQTTAGRLFFAELKKA
ncbi:MAG TPA: PIN domain-containing protein [Chthoniobacteraceae bacterium]|nr:PIN domain-containing protein [Chthoniobacteraceae bacterium]